jgi:hypothetical protein
LRAQATISATCCSPCSSEHQRRAFSPEEAEPRLREAARAKLAEIRESYEECGGTEGYWRELEREVMVTALSQYIPAAIEQTRLEGSGYDIWRRGDPAARAAFGLLGLLLGALIIAIPWIPIFEDAFAFILAASGFLYPEIKKTYFDYGHSRLLNRLIGEAEKYQRNERIQYMSEARLREELEEVEKTAPRPKSARNASSGTVVDHPSSRQGGGKEPA